MYFKSNFGTKPCILRRVSCRSLCFYNFLPFSNKGDTKWSNDRWTYINLNKNKGVLQDFSMNGMQFSEYTEMGPRTKVVRAYCSQWAHVIRPDLYQRTQMIISTAHEFRHRGIIFSTFLSLPNFMTHRKMLLVRSFSLKLRRFKGVLNHVSLNVSLEKQIQYLLTCSKRIRL